MLDKQTYGNIKYTFGLGVSVANCRISDGNKDLCLSVFCIRNILLKYFER